jgi:hypothetical protein
MACRLVTPRNRPLALGAVGVFVGFVSIGVLRQIALAPSTRIHLSNGRVNGVGGKEAGKGGMRLVALSRDGCKRIVAELTHAPRVRMR